MKLSQKEIRVLAVCETNAQISVEQISKKSGLKPHVVRHALKSLENRLIIHRRAYFNSFLLGTLPYLFAFSLSTEGKRKKTKLLQYLKSSPEVSYFAEVGGSYNVFVEVRSENTFRLQSFLDRLSLSFGNIFEAKALLALTSMNDFSVTASISERPSVREFATELLTTRVDLDPKDLLILKNLALHWGDSDAKVARQMNMPLTSYDYHLKKMVKSGLILGARYHLDLARVGLHTFYHLVSARGFHPNLRQKMLDFARKDPAVHCLRTFIGEWDFIFECHYDDYAFSIDFVERLDHALGAEIESINSLPVLKHVKVSDCTVFDTKKLC